MMSKKWFDLGKCCKCLQIDVSRTTILKYGQNLLANLTSMTIVHCRNCLLGFGLGTAEKIWFLGGGGGGAMFTDRPEQAWSSLKIVGVGV
jgi:hypothetical protein